MRKAGNITTPTETWKKNNWRIDLRNYTRKFEKKFGSKRTDQISEPGKIYAISYKRNSKFETDKHHVTPLIISFGRFKDADGEIYVRGLNLLFLKTHQSLEILEDAFLLRKEKLDDRALGMIKLHMKYIKIYPYCFKNFAEKRILTQEEVKIDEWGMIPLLHKYLWGTFNPTALNEAFQEEEKVTRKNVKKKTKKSEPFKEKRVSYKEDSTTNYRDISPD